MELTPAVPWNCMELGVRQFRWHEQFHGIPWNSMELQVRQFRWHEQIHGILWNLECANFADTSSSMDFLGIPWTWECANFADTSSSMEFHGTSSAPISLTRAVPWNSMELGVRQFRWHEEFHRFLWNLECANFDDMSSFMEFQGIPWNLQCGNIRVKDYTHPYGKTVSIWIRSWTFIDIFYIHILQLLALCSGLYYRYHETIYCDVIFTMIAFFNSSPKSISPPLSMVCCTYGCYLLIK